MPVNDSHCHFFSRHFFEQLASPLERFQGSEGIEHLTSELGWETPGSPSRLADRWADELDRHGVERAALIDSLPTDEDSVAEAVAGHPNRFVGFFMVDPTREDARERAGKAVQQKGLRVACLFPAMHDYRLEDERVAAIFEIFAERSGCAIFVHCGLLSVGVRKKLGLPSLFDMRLGNPLDLQRIAQKHPELPLIIPHFGAGFFREALMLARLCENIFFDTSSSNSWVQFLGIDLKDAFAQALAVLGPERLLFGTDSSFFPRGWNQKIYATQKSCLESLGLSQHEKDLIFAENFNRLFPG